MGPLRVLFLLTLLFLTVSPQSPLEPKPPAQVGDGQALPPLEAPLKVPPQIQVGDGQPPRSRRRRHSSHFPICSFCCGCCGNRGCGFCCRS